MTTVRISKEVIDIMDVSVFKKDVENYLEEVNKWVERVNLCAALIPNNSKSSLPAVMSYQLLYNFLFTEYEFLYNGRRVSEYREKRNPNCMCYDRLEGYLKKKGAIKAKMHTNTEKAEIDSIFVRHNAAGTFISDAQMILKKCVKGNDTPVMKSLLQHDIVYTTTSGQVPYLNISNTSVTFDRKCPGYTPTTADEILRNHEWSSNVIVKEQPLKKKKMHSTQSSTTATGKEKTNFPRKGEVSKEVPNEKQPASIKRKNPLVVEENEDAHDHIGTSDVTAEGTKGEAADVPNSKYALVVEENDDDF